MFAGWKWRAFGGEEQTVGLHALTMTARSAGSLG